MAHNNINPLPASRDPFPRTSALESTTRSSRHRATIHRPRTVIRPLPFFHPTRASFAPHHSSAKEQIEGGLHARWSSRASRKHRYSRRPIRLAHPPAAKSEGALRNGPLRECFSLLEQRVRHTEDQVKVHLAWDLSFWVAIIFVLGSTAWVRAAANGVFLRSRRTSTLNTDISTTRRR